MSSFIDALWGLLSWSIIGLFASLLKSEYLNRKEGMLVHFYLSLHTGGKVDTDVHVYGDVIFKCNV